MQFLEEKITHLFRLGTDEWLSSPLVGDAVRFAHDPCSSGIVLGQLDAHTVYVAWSRAPADALRQIRKAAEEVQEEIDAGILRDLASSGFVYAQTER